MKGLTHRQRQTLQFIEHYLDLHGFAPTVREVASHLEITTKGAHDHLRALQRKGCITRGSRRSRAITVIANGAEAPEVVDIPVLGTVVAGQPLLNEENLDGTYPLPRSSIGTGDHFALHVRGDSMKDAGIHDGDLAVIRQQPTATDGDIVVAMIDDAVTLKRFYKESRRVRLQAENSAYPPIYATDLRILGKLACLVRDYR
jgi:repressor LexA